MVFLTDEDELRREHERYEELERAWRHRTGLQIIPHEDTEEKPAPLSPDQIQGILDDLDTPKPPARTPYLH